MAIRTLAQLKAWFKTGQYPTAAQFADWMDSFFHRDDKLPIASVEDLPLQLNGKYPASDGKELEKKTDIIAADLTLHKSDTKAAFERVHGNLTELESEDAKIRADFAAADASTLASAKAHTNARENVLREEYVAGDAATLASAKEHTAELDSILRGEQVAADAETLTNANGYTDGREAAIRRDFAAADATHEAVVRNDMATGDATTLQTAREHTDTREGVIRQDVITSIAGTLSSAKTYTDNKVAELVSGTPEALDTLRELSIALGDDPNFATTITTKIGGKVDKVPGKGLSTEDYTSADREKLAGVDAGANNYAHPITHPASMIQQDALHRFVSDEQCATWDSMSDEDATPTTSGMMSAADKAKLDSVAAGANNFTHPATHPASMIQQDESRRFITDKERLDWNSKADGDHNHDNDYIPKSAATDYARAYGCNASFGGDFGDITTTEFVELLAQHGAFDQGYWIARGSWIYATNRTISDTSIGRIHLAGAVIETVGDRNNHTIRVTTSTTAQYGGELRRVFVYINNGPEYSPGWFKLANHETATHGVDGLMSASDKVKIDNLPASAMKTLDIVEAPDYLTIEGGKSYHFNGPSLTVYDSNYLTPAADTCMITVPGNTHVSFGTEFRKIAGFNDVVSFSSQRQVFVIQLIPLAADNHVRAVTRGVYD